jgi:zinc protease
MVTIEGSILGGSAWHPKNRTVPALAARMLEEGTKRRSRRQIREELESRGASIDFWTDAHFLRFVARCLKQDGPRIVALLGEMLREPAFPRKEFDIVKKKYIGELEELKDDTRSAAASALSRVSYPPEHPNYMPEISALILSARATSLLDIKGFHASLGLGTMLVVCAGDTDERALERAFAKALKGWRTSLFSGRPSRSRARAPALSRTIITFRDKQNADLYFGSPLGMTSVQPDFYALKLAFQVLGGGFSSRLLREVREKRGLTYGTAARIAGFVHGDDGYWFAWGTFAPALFKQGEEAMREQFELFAKRGITAKELADRKEAIAGLYEVGMDTTEGLASLILDNAENMKPLTFLDDYLIMIEGLSIGQVNAAIKKYIKPDKLVIVAAGALKADGTPLS